MQWHECSFLLSSNGGVKITRGCSVSYAADGAQGIQDGSYSRGPISLLPDDLAASNEDYYKSPTFKIEQVNVLHLMPWVCIFFCNKGQWVSLQVVFSLQLTYRGSNWTPNICEFPKVATKETISNLQCFSYSQ